VDLSILSRIIQKYEGIHDEDSEGVIVGPRKVQQCLLFIHTVFLIEIVTVALFKQPMSKATKKAAWEILVHNTTSTRSIYIYIYIYILHKRYYNILDIR
jgi:hypothetical protein